MEDEIPDFVLQSGETPNGNELVVGHGLVPVLSALCFVFVFCALCLVLGIPSRSILKASQSTKYKVLRTKLLRTTC